MADAIDQAVRRARMADSAERLARDTAAYFEALGDAAGAEENRLGAALAEVADEIDFDNRRS